MHSKNGYWIWNHSVNPHGTKSTHVLYQHQHSENYIDTA